MSGSAGQWSTSCPRGLEVWCGAGQFPIVFGYSFLSDTYPDVSWCILHVSWRIHVSRVYPDVSQMYLTSPVTFQENTCILTFCMYFTRIPNESKIHFGIHIRYITIHVSWTLPWCHTGYMSGYIKIRVSWTLLHDTSRYMFKIHMRDTYGIH
jgi:hypothetical protein